MQVKSFMFQMILSELEDVVGVENVSTSEVDRASYTVDYFWLSRMWHDRGAEGPKPDIIVRPGCTEEVSKVLKIANYYKIPVHTAKIQNKTADSRNNGIFYKHIDIKTIGKKVT